MYPAAEASKRSKDKGLAASRRGLDRPPSSAGLFLQDRPSGSRPWSSCLCPLDLVGFGLFAWSRGYLSLKKCFMSVGKDCLLGFVSRGTVVLRGKGRGSAKVRVVTEGSGSRSPCPSLPSAFQLFTGYCPPGEAPQVADRRHDTESPLEAAVFFSLS